MHRDPFIFQAGTGVTCPRPPRVQMQAHVTLEPPFFQAVSSLTLIEMVEQTAPGGENGMWAGSDGNTGGNR